MQFRNEQGTIEFAPPSLHVDDRIGLSTTIFGDAFEYLQSVAAPEQTPKLTIPSPSMVHYRGGRAAIDESVYPGPRRVLGGPDRRVRRGGAAARRGRLHATCSSTTRASPTSTTRPSASTCARSAATPSTSTRPTSATSTRRSRTGRRGWRSRRTCAAATSAPPGWPRAATTSSPRRCSASSTSTASSWSGTTRARAASSRCASCRRASWSCSGLVTTKRGELEDADMLKRRIEEASRYVDLDQLCLSPQCGFSSTVEGNALTPRAAGGQAAAGRRGRRGGLGLGGARRRRARGGGGAPRRHRDGRRLRARRRPADADRGARGERRRRAS